MTGPARRPASPRSLDDCLAFLLARASAAVAGSFHEVLREAGVTLAQWRVLTVLSDRAAIAITDLAAVVPMKQPTLTKLVDRLEAGGLVRRYSSAEDRRRTLVEITGRGHDLLLRLMPRARAHEAEVLGAIAAAEVEALKRRLRALIGVALSKRN